MKADLEKMLGLRGLSFFTNSFQIHNTGGIRRDHVGSFNTISNIEALATTRLSELWLQQKFFNDKFSIRFGQLVADAEFFISDYSALLMTSDWPSITAQNLPSGGPAYPLSTPGVRLKYRTEQAIRFSSHCSTAIRPARGREDAQIKNRYGLNFRVQDPPLLMGEAQYRYNQDKDGDRPCGFLPTRFLASLRRIRQPALRRKWTFARQSAQYRHRGAPARHQRHLRGGRSSALSSAPAAGRTAASVCSAAPASARPTAIRSSSISTAESCFQA